MSNSKSSKIILKYFFMTSAVISISYFWFLIFNFVNTAKSESWMLPIIIFSLVFIFWALAIILENNRKRLLLFGIALIFSGGLFTQNILFLVFSFFAILILYLSVVWIHESMETRIKLNIWMSLRLGRKLFVMAISLVIIGGFLMPVLLSGEERVLPVVHIGEKQMNIIGRVMAVIDSNFNFEELSKMTVDEYIMKEQEGFLKNNNISIRQLTAMEKSVFLSSGRADIARLVNRQLDGGEKIMDVFIEIVNNKINNYFNTEISQSSDFAPLLFSGLSFFAVFSIGSFITVFLTLLVEVIFKLLLLTKLVKLDKKKVEVEVIN